MMLMALEYLGPFHGSTEHNGNLKHPSHAGSNTLRRPSLFIGGNIINLKTNPNPERFPRILFPLIIPNQFELNVAP